MPKFLTTAGATYHIEDIIQRAQTTVTLITPYLKLSQTLAERLKDADKIGVKITLIYGKEELRADQKEILTKLKNLELYFFENLHAKCYFNESSLVISSMNLYETSQNKNREMGVLFDSKEDKQMYDAAIKEALSIKDASICKKSTGGTSEVKTTESDFDLTKIHTELSKMYPLKKIEEAVIEGIRTIIIHDFPSIGMQVHVSGIVTFMFLSDSKIKEFDWLKTKVADALATEMSYHRIYWNRKWNRSEISIYQGKNVDRLKTVEDYVRTVKITAETLKRNFY